MSKEALKKYGKQAEEPCDTCGGSGTVDTRPAISGLDTLTERDIPCPDCQTTEPEGSELTKELRDFGIQMLTIGFIDEAQLKRFNELIIRACKLLDGQKEKKDAE